MSIEDAYGRLAAENKQLAERLAVVEDRERKLHESYDSLSERRVAAVQERDECRRLLREACIGYEHNYDDASGDKRLRRVPIFHTWYEQAAKAAGGM